jgi:hypothetical protein
VEGQFPLVASISPGMPWLRRPIGIH